MPYATLTKIIPSSSSRAAFAAFFAREDDRAVTERDPNRVVGHRFLPEVHRNPQLDAVAVVAAPRGPTDGFDERRWLRHRGYTLYQASYREDPQTGTKASTFAVVHNYGRLLPYISTGIIVGGMIWHFVFMLIKRAKRKEATL